MIQANDLAHKAMLRDLIPMVAIHKKHTDKELAGFQSRLENTSSIGIYLRILSYI